MVLLKNVYLHSIGIINFYTFASPRVGNIHFAEEVKRVTKGFYRIVNLSDVVPTLPIAAMPNINNTSDPFIYKTYRDCSRI
jgi:predicted lipase